ncbi:MAG: Uma2 family endonuclease, partial [Nostoc sp. TH1S01]|nr:Uma2 family endonuclease [Nostoc sp. TH1S01]
TRKLKTYAKLGVLYYVIYNSQYWQRDQHQPFEVYKLVEGKYQLQIGEPFWMPEIQLGIGRSNYISGVVQREVLYWYDQTGDRYLTSEEIAQAERQKREKLAAKLRELGIDPEKI